MDPSHSFIILLKLLFGEQTLLLEAEIFKDFALKLVRSLHEAQAGQEVVRFVTASNGPLEILLLARRFLLRNVIALLTQLFLMLKLHQRISPSEEELQELGCNVVNFFFCAGLFSDVGFFACLRVSHVLLQGFEFLISNLV